MLSFVLADAWAEGILGLLASHISCLPAEFAPVVCILLPMQCQFRNQPYRSVALPYLHTMGVSLEAVSKAVE
jgi:hypothetical protein